MKHGMTVRTDGHQIVDRVHLVLPSNGGDRHYVVNMNVATPDFSVFFLKVQATYSTNRPVMIDACSSGGFATLVGVHENCTSEPFHVKNIAR